MKITQWIYGGEPGRLQVSMTPEEMDFLRRIVDIGLETLNARGDRRSWPMTQYAVMNVWLRDNEGEPNPLRAIHHTIQRAARKPKREPREPSEPKRGRRPRPKAPEAA